MVVTPRPGLCDLVLLATVAVFVVGLKHCYKLLIDLGPVSHDKAVAACGYLGGATVVTFDNPGDEVSNFLDGYSSFQLFLLSALKPNS